MDELKIRQEYNDHMYNYRPSWIIRWGITVFFVILVLIIIGSGFVKYPDIVHGVAHVTTLNPPIVMRAKTTGRIEDIFIKQDQFVQKGEPLAILESSSNWNDIAIVDQTLNKIDSIIKNENWNRLIEIKELPKHLSLGNLQSQYTQLVQVYSQLYSILSSGIYENTKKSLENKVEGTKKLISEGYDKLKLLNEQVIIIKKDIERDSLLHLRGMISDANYEQSKRVLLQAKTAIIDTKITIHNLEIANQQTNDENKGLKLNHSEDILKIKTLLYQNIELMKSQIENWKQTYTFISPENGHINLSSFWSIGQTVRSGEGLLTLIPKKETSIKVRVLVPILSSGKIKKGQRVNIKLSNYPYQEYGFLIGKVNHVSKIPSDSIYSVDITLKDGLITSYKKTLPNTLELHGQAEIITNDISLLMRFFNPLRAIFDNRIKDRN